MFTTLAVTFSPPDRSPQTHECAVNFEKGLVIPFSGDVSECVKAFNSGASDPMFYCKWPIRYCKNAETGASLEEPFLDSPETKVVNILGLDYAVPLPVSNYIDTLKSAVTGAADEIRHLKDARKCRCKRECDCHQR